MGERAQRIDVFDPQEETSAVSLRAVIIQQSGIGMTEMKKAIRRWRKAIKGLRPRLIHFIIMAEISCVVIDLFAASSLC